MVRRSNDPSLAQALTPHLELGLDQQDQVAGRLDQVAQDRQDHAQ